MNTFAKRCSLCGTQANVESSNYPQEIGTVVQCPNCGTYGYALPHELSHGERQCLAAYVRRESERGRTMPVIRKDNWQLLVRLGELLSTRTRD